MRGVDSGHLVVFDRCIGRSWDEKVFWEISSVTISRQKMKKKTNVREIKEHDILSA